MKWEVKPLGEVCAVLNGRAYKKTELLDLGRDLVLRVGNFFTNKKYFYSDLDLPEKNYCESGDLLYAWSASFGPRIWQGGRAVFHYHIWKMVPESTIMRDFLFWFLKWDVDQVKRAHGTGTTMIHVTKRDMEARKIPIPALEEQERIVEILDEAFAAIDKAKANIERNLTNARELFQSRLNDIFSNPSEDWVVKPLGEVCGFVRGPFGGSLKKNCFVESGYAVYEQKHPIHGDFSSFRYFINSEKFEEMRRFEVEPGNVLMSCSGTIGRTKVVPEGAPKGIINQALLNLKPKEGLVPLFLKKWMESIDFLVQIEERSAGAALKNVASVKILKTIEVRIPPFGEQVQICEKLYEFAAMTKAVETRYQTELDNLEELRQSILEQAFEGKLTEPVAA